MATINSSDLDFNTIKNNLKTYFQQQSEFADYNFEASGLSNILDVLAYNTHLNGLIANVGINESFLSSSQLRSSVVSHAENLGYYPRSKTGASIDVTVTVKTSDTATSTITLPAYSSFTSDVDGTTYNFLTTAPHIGTNDGSGNFSIRTSAADTSIPITQGTLRTKTFLVGETEDQQVYVIPDENLDTSTITVKVFDTVTSTTSQTYTNVNEVLSITPSSTVYILREAPNGYYELTFSDGTILGRAPAAGNKIVVQYLAVDGADANLASIFEGNFTITGLTINEIEVSPSVSGSVSAGGAEKESIDSIKVNAPIKFASQQRLVTAEDYKALILANYGNVIDNVTAWGGNDNVPPVYGRVYVSLDFKDNISNAVKTTTKASIQSNLSESLAILSIDTFFTDPVNTFLELEVTFNFDPDQTGVSSANIENTVRNTITTFFTNNLGTFDSVFRRSNLLSEIDDVSSAILNSKMDVKIRQSFTPVVNTIRDYTVNFPVQIVSPDDEAPIITSTTFTFQGNSGSSLRNKIEHNTTTMQIISSEGTVLKDNAGSFNTSNGTITLTGFNVSEFTGTEIKITATPANQSTIKPLRNYIISLDTTKLVITSNADFQNTEASLSL
jgi:hypothetical protein